MPAAVGLILVVFFAVCAKVMDNGIARDTCVQPN